MKRASGRGAKWIDQLLPGFDDVGALVARFNLRRVYYWLFLASLVGFVGGVGALVFKWLADGVLAAFWRSASSDFRSIRPRRSSRRRIPVNVLGCMPSVDEIPLAVLAGERPRTRITRRCGPVTPSDLAMRLDRTSSA